MPIPEHQIYGERVFMLKPDKVARRSREVHTLTGRWQTAAEDHFKIGDAPPFYPNMRIVTVDPETEIIGEAYDVRIDCEGIIGDDTFLELDRSDGRPEEGWDQTSLRVFTREPESARWNKGARLVNDVGVVAAGFERMYITDCVRRVHRAKDYSELEITLKGLRTAKGYKRRINGASTTSNAKPADGTTMVLSDHIYAGYPPVYTGVDASLSGPDLVVEFEASTLSLVDVWISDGDPPTERIGGFWTPPNPPNVSINLLSGVDYKYFFPWGWKCTAMPCEQIPGTNLWLVSSSFTYQVEKMPV